MTRWICAALLSCLSGGVALGGGQIQLYRLRAPSSLELQLCLPPCACPQESVTGPLRGSFFLEPLSPDPLFENFAVRGVHWFGVLPDLRFDFVGFGTYRFGGEVAVTQEMRLDLAVNGDLSLHADSGLNPAFNQFPWIEIEVPTEQFGCRRFTLRLLASPDFCPSDLDGDGRIGLSDLASLLVSFGTVEGASHDQGDTNGDGAVDLVDLANLLADYGSVCPP